MEAIATIKDINEDQLTLSIDPAFLYELHNLDPDEEYTVKIEKKGKARTLHQNSYLWKLIEQIALETYGRASHQVREDIYCNMLEEAGAKTDVLTVIPEAEKRLRELFRRVRYLDTDGKMNQYLVYYGSSKFDTKEMSKLIDVALDWAEQAGIPQAYWRDLLEQ